MFARNGYNYDVEEASADTGLSCPPVPDLARQEFLEETDINVIARRFGLTGEMPTKYAAPTYAEFGEVFDYHSALTSVREADQAFLTLPAGVRDRFSNDPQLLLEFLEDRRNLSEAAELGLVPPVPPPPAESSPS